MAGRRSRIRGWRRVPPTLTTPDRPDRIQARRITSLTSFHAARTALRKAERQRDPTAPDLFHCPHLTPARLQYPELPYYTNDRRAMSDKPYLFARLLRHALPLREHRLDQDAE